MKCPSCQCENTKLLSAVFSESSLAIHARPPEMQTSSRTFVFLLFVPAGLAVLHSPWWLLWGLVFVIAFYGMSIAETRHNAEAMAAWARTRQCMECGISWDELRLYESKRDTRRAEDPVPAEAAAETCDARLHAVRAEHAR